MKLKNCLFIIAILILKSNIGEAQIKLDIVKAGFSIGKYLDNDSVKSSNAWGINMSYEHFWKKKHFSTTMNINTFKTTFDKYNPKIKNFTKVNDLMGSAVVDIKYYPLKIENSPFLGIGLGAHICDCYGFNKLDKIREGIGGFDLHISSGYQIIVAEKWAINIAGDYSLVRPTSNNFLKKYMGILQIGYVLD